MADIESGDVNRPAAVAYEHFGWPIHAAVEEVNKYFQGRLFSILAGAK